MSCKHKDALGRPSEGVHRPRLFGLAAFDLLGTAGLAYFGAKAVGHGHVTPQTLIGVFVALVLLAILLHEHFCVNTRLNAALFGRKWPKSEEEKIT